MRTYTKALIIVVPVLLLITAIAVNQIYLMPAANDPAPSHDLQLLGYGNWANNEFGTPLTLSNAGREQIVILNVTYDGKSLTQGVLGGTMPLNAVSSGQNSSLCSVPTNVLIFAVPDQWNMDTGGLCTATIMPGGVATVYLGVFSITNSTHVVVIVTDEGNFTFTLIT